MSSIGKAVKDLEELVKEKPSPRRKGTGRTAQRSIDRIWRRTRQLRETETERLSIWIVKEIG
jgi:hypothetical protein